MRTGNSSWLSTMRRVGIGLLAASSAALLVILVLRIFHKSLHGSVSLLAFIFFAVAAFFFYFFWTWLFFVHPSEIARKFPITGKELRKRKKDFYDTLPR
jgi:chromate transport protein ChrA